MMVPEVKGLLLDALKSGEYQQAKGYLKIDKDGVTGYCCLGVLCDIADKVTDLDVSFSKADGEFRAWSISRTEKEADGYEFKNNYSAYPPDDVRDWAGLTDGQMVQLANINDEGDSFDAVIEHIETNL